MKVKVPARISVTGDKQTGQLLIGYALSQLTTLETDMRRARPKPLNEGFRTIQPFPGVVIEAWSSFNLHDVRVHVEPGVYMSVEEIKREDESKVCPCFPHFSLARIIAVDPEEPVQGETESAEDFAGRWATWLSFLKTGKFTYDIEICASDRYILFLGAEDKNYGKYYPSQVVMVSLGEEMEDWDVPLDCARACLLDIPRFEALSVTPIHNASGMIKWHTI